jgi:malonate decarboxylase epsilon subunit
MESIDHSNRRERMITFLYPGQGAQHAGMLAALPDRSSVETTFSSVSEVLGYDVRDLDTADALSSTVAAQLALFTVGVASTRLLADDDIRPDAVAGHSIGAFAAAVAAGVLTLEEGTAAVRLRAERMRDLYPTGFGLLALLGTRLADAERLVADSRRPDDLFVAMENAEDQIVLAGSDAAFEQVEAAAPRYGVREIRRLEVAVPSHCLLMSPAAASVADLLRTIPSRRPTVRYLSAMTARSALTGPAVLDDLAGGVARMVRWRDTTDLLAELGTSLVVQVAPGHATAALFASAHPGIPVVAVDDSSFDDSRLRIRRILESR